ncbi:MAG: hypothetical protein ACTSWF_11110 [Candidatus Freyarchaeota archaeon]
MLPLCLGIAVFISLIAEVYPAWRASGLKPVETLRYKLRTSDAVFMLM